MINNILTVIGSLDIADVLDCIEPQSECPSSSLFSFCIFFAINLTYATRVVGVTPDNFGLNSTILSVSIDMPSRADAIMCFRRLRRLRLIIEVRVEPIGSPTTVFFRTRAFQSLDFLQTVDS